MSMMIILCNHEILELEKDTDEEDNGAFGFGEVKCMNLGNQLLNASHKQFLM